MSQAAAAFDAEAAVYDASFGRNVVGRLFRAVFQQRLEALFPPGARVLEIGCGTGDDALFLAARGVRVHALDIAPNMVARARAKAATRGFDAARVRFETRAAEDVGGTAGAPFDGAYSDFGALNCVDLEVFGRGLHAVLVPGAPLLFSVMGRFPLPAVAWDLATRAEWPRGRRVPRVAGIEVPVCYPSPACLRRALGPGFTWRGAAALGVLVPDPHFAPWLERRPRLLAALARLEAQVRRWPLLRAFGDHTLHEGRRT